MIEAALNSHALKMLSNGSPVPRLSSISRSDPSEEVASRCTLQKGLLSHGTGQIRARPRMCHAHAYQEPETAGIRSASGQETCIDKYGKRWC